MLGGDPAQAFVESVVRHQEADVVGERGLGDHHGHLAARGVYDELMGPRGVSGKAVRVASDKDIRDNLRSAIDDLRNAADRIQKGPSHKGRNLLLVSGIAIGIFLFNPMTGADARRWLKESVFGEEDEFGYQGNSGS